MSRQSSPRVTVRAILLSDRIDTVGLERPNVLSTTPLAFRVEGDAFVVVFRYGVVVLFGLTPLQEDEIIQSLDRRTIGRYARREQETTQIEIAPDKDEQIAPNGTILLKALLPEHVLLIADAIATNVILAHDERNVSAVFDVMATAEKTTIVIAREKDGKMPLS